jgi:DNA-directed RNA polymerase specialized sigma subunit
MTMNPALEFLELRNKTASKKAEDDLALWHTWNQNGRSPEHLQPLLQRYEPLLKRRQREWSAGARAVSPSAFHAELQKQFINAADSFDPERGVAFNTHVQNRIQKAQRYRAKYQNVGYIPEAQAAYIGPLEQAQEELSDQFGRAPTHAELATHMGLPEKRVTSLVKSLRKDVPASQFESDPYGTATSRETDVIRLMQNRPHEYLNHEETQVFNHVFGVNGARKITDTTGLASQLGISQPKVSRLKTSIANKIKKNM